MVDTLPKKVNACPACSKPVDPLRSPAVSVIEGHITHFCSVDCREKFLNRRPQKKVESKVTSVPETDDTLKDDKTSDPFPLPASEEQAALLQSKLLRPQIITTAIFLTFSAIVIFLPPLFNGLLSPLVVAVLALGRLSVSLVRNRRASPLRMLEGIALPAAILAVLAGVLFGLPARLTAVAMALLLTVESLGRLFELIGRHRSGVLSAVDDSHEVALPESWRDNSLFAEKTKRFSMVVEWIRFPLALMVGALTYFVTAQSIPDTLLSVAVALIGVNPRILRMATGDAHLAAALMASKRAIAVRDAHAVDALSRTRIALFMGNRTLVTRDLHVVDWETLPDANEQSILDALVTAESSIEGAIAEAVVQFAIARKARPTGTVDVTPVPGLGIIGTTPWGRLICGARQLLLNEEITTGLLESKAAKIEQSGRRAVFLAIDGALLAVFGLEEHFQKNAENAVQTLRHLGMETALATTAEIVAAEALCKRLGIDTAIFETTEASIGRVLHHISERGDKAVLIGSGPHFEEHLRTAAASIAFHNTDRTQAGFDTDRDDITLIPWLIRIARRAGLSAMINLILGLAVVLFSLGIAVSWFSPLVVLAAGTMTAAVAAGTTFNAPYPWLNAMTDRITVPFKRIHGRVQHALRRQA